MPKQRTGLGRGIDALIPDNLPMADDSYLDTSLPPTGIFEIPIGAVALNPQQPRAPLVEDDALLELAASIQEYGLLQPVLVTISGTDEDGTRYQLIAGERRLHAAQLAGLERVPAVIKEATPQLMLEMALVENLQRTDLNPLEEAQGYVMLIEEYGLTQEAVAQRVGRNRVTISNTIRLLQLPERVRGWLLTNPQTFSEGHARAVLQINGEDERIQAAQQIIAQEMSVRAAEELARRYNEASMLLTADRRGGKSRPQSYETKALEDEFTRAVQLKVRLQRTTRGKGSLTLYFSNEEQLQ
ncbi:MAG TPA: ParB/RepB/Spo0J family partition protein, partial [Ktedonobacterales bacterium]|nr:ParB/RepB/Spo0J family partition protein [Ktedonobacterales bacterium]